MKKLLGITVLLGSVILNVSGFARETIADGNDFPKLDAIVKNPNGDPTFGRSEAIAYCHNHGTRVPTARELAWFGMSHGAKGILETDDVNGQVPEGFHLIVTLEVVGNSDSFINGESDSFYYSNEGYDPGGDSSGLWSSSVNYDVGSPLVFDGQAGDFILPSSSFVMGSGLRCLSTH